jgi:hypothetical protein
VQKFNATLCGPRHAPQGKPNLFHPEMGKKRDGHPGSQAELSFHMIAMAVEAPNATGRQPVLLVHQ